jgi:phosphoglycerol transferase MdoB-like AlkP superfamily enzyme
MRHVRAAWGRLPRIVRFGVVLAGVHVALFSLFRLAFWQAFDNTLTPLPADRLLQSLLTGLRFDIRLGLFLVLPLLLLALTRWTHPLQVGWMRGLARLYLTVAGIVLLTSYVVDFGHYAYLAQRLNAGSLYLLRDWREAAYMVWQSYPVIPLTVALWVVLALYSHAMGRLLAWGSRLPPAPHWQGGRWARRGKATTLGVVLALPILFGMHGKWSQYPLRWSDAFFSTDPFASSVALNPVLYLLDTLDFRQSGADEAKVRSLWPVLAPTLGLPSSPAVPPRFVRTVTPRLPAPATPPNIVLVLLESFSGYKTSLSGNPLGTTPNFDRIAREGVWFERLYTPHFGTARGVFTTLTGIPDVEINNTSSRNPKAAEQHLVLDDVLHGYDRHYFIGGSTSWANIRGVLTRNIAGIRIHEEGDYRAPRNDVWGISDLDLFDEAHQVFRQAQKPFFAVIQTSGNHRPYTIPQRNQGFVPKQWQKDQLENHGFFSLEEYNSFHFMDHALGQFFTTAARESYFRNTLFLLVGDHGITAQGKGTGPHMPAAYTDLKLSSVHTPFVIYAPHLLAPARYRTTASQADVMATLAGLTGRPYRNTTLGRDLLDPRDTAPHVAFTIEHDSGPTIGVLDERFYLQRRPGATTAVLYDMTSPTPRTDVSAAHPQIAAHMTRLTDAMYYTAQYMLLNNPKLPPLVAPAHAKEP